jgi:tripeptide aminopeptidase
MQKTVTNTIIQQLQKNEKVNRAVSFFAANAGKITQEQLELCAIPAPPFGEQKRAEFFRQMLVKIGYENARIDREGNVLALREGKELRPLLVVSAHLDTVFPATVDLTPRFENSKIFAPGIMDDGCGLIAVTAIAEALNAAGIETEGSILFVGTVGEEGAGNLRGVRHLFTNGEYASQISAFISFDGAGVAQIVNRALGSRRYQVKLTSVGGHSWLDFGAPNPIHALGRAIAKLSAFQLSPKEKTTFNVGKIAGGTSVNTIASEAVLEVDLRSESDKELHRLDAFFRRAVFEAVDEENDARNARYDALEFDLQMTGERPGGATAESSPLVQLAIEATKAVKVEPQLTISSTDSNVPMSLDFPAVTLGAGGAGDKMHTLGEWYDPTNRAIGLERALLLILAYVGVLEK